MSLSVWSWWAMDAFSLISTYLAATVITAQHIMRNITQMTFMIPSGIQTAASILIGNNIGANRIPVAKAYSQTCVSSTLLMAFATVGLMSVFQGPIIELFTKDAQVRSQIETAYMIMLVFIILDLLQMVG